MKKSFHFRKYCNKRLLVLSLLCYLIFIIVLYGLFWALFSSKEGVTLFINYSNFIFPLRSNSPKYILHLNEIVNKMSSLATLENNKYDTVLKPPKTRTKANAKPMPKSCTGRYIYVLDLPGRFNDDILKNCSTLVKWMDMCKAILNYGLGPQVTESNGVLQKKGWFATNQYALDIIFRNKMKQYRCLTNDSSRASAIYVPFYAGLDLGRKLFDSSNASVRDSSPLDLVRLLTAKPEWKHMRGRDHFFVSGRVTWDFMRLTDDDSEWGSKLLSLPEVLNMTMLTIESSPWGHKDFAIPHPTYFHPSSDHEVFEWQNRMRKQRRPYLFSFAGGLQPNVPYSIRHEIVRQCLASGKRCQFLDCNSPGNDCQNPVTVMNVLTKSTFCLEPAGDSFTRRSTFDSILAGCVPVFFHIYSAYSQFKWHLPTNHTKYSVFIPEDDIRNGNVSIGQILIQISQDKVSAMREKVIEMIPRVTYANPRFRLETIEDAFDIALRKVLEKMEAIEEGHDHMHT